MLSPTWRCGAWAVVKLCDGSVHRGVVHTVDPETGSVILLRPSDEGDPMRVKPLVVFAHSIAAFSQGDEEGAAGSASSSWVAESLISRSDAAETQQPGLDDEAVEARRVALCKLLTKQRVPFADEGGDGLLVLKSLRVLPPYTARSCRCENETVLDRFIALIEAAQLPGDV